MRRPRAACACAAAFDDPRDCGLRMLLENTSGMGIGGGRALRGVASDSRRRRRSCRWESAWIRRTHSRRATRFTPKRGWRRRSPALERTVGLERVAVLHVNDSKTPLGSRVDRHEHIGRGKIGLEAFRAILIIRGFALRRVRVDWPGRAFHSGNADRCAGRRSAQRARAVGTGGREREAGAARGERLQHAARERDGAASARPRRYDEREAREPREAHESDAESSSRKAEGRIERTSQPWPNTIPQAIEQKWQQRVGRGRARSRRRRSRAAEILPAGNAAVSLRHAAHGPHAQLHHRRRRGAVPAHARLQRAAPDRLGRVRPAGGKRRDQARHRIRANGPTPTSRR